MQQETIENYCKTVYELDKGEGVKSVDIADGLSISKISVSITLHKLRDEGYISMKKYGKVKLTDKGKCVARKISGKHKAIEDFLEQCLGIERGKALSEACAIEHHLSDETVRKLANFCKRVNNKK